MKKHCICLPFDIKVHSDQTRESSQGTTKVCPNVLRCCVLKDVRLVDHCRWSCPSWSAQIISLLGFYEGFARQFLSLGVWGVLQEIASSDDLVKMLSESSEFVGVSEQEEKRKKHVSIRTKRESVSESDALSQTD